MIAQSTSLIVSADRVCRQSRHDRIAFATGDGQRRERAWQLPGGVTGGGLNHQWVGRRIADE